MKTKIKTSKNTNRKSVKKWIVIISSVFVLLGCGQMAIASDITTQKMVELTNESRKKLGLLPLKINDKLTAAAKAKADDMFRFQYFDHNSPSGVTPWYWIKSARYDYLYAGENLAIDFVTAEGSHMALMRSITHRDNILKPNYTEIGIAVKKGIFDGNESIIIVQQFGAPLEKIIVVEKNNKSEVDIKGDADINLPESKEEIKIAEPKHIKEPKTELVEIKSPVVYFKDENYKEDENKENKNDDENSKADESERIMAEKINEEFVLPIMFPVENIKPLDKTLTENIFWINYEEESEGAFSKIISFFNYKFWLVKTCASI